MYVKVPTGYLALRSAMGYDAANEIGELNTGKEGHSESHDQKNGDKPLSLIHI